MRRLCLFAFLYCSGFALQSLGQTTPAAAPAGAGQTPDAATAWKSLSQPAFDMGKSATVKDLTLARDRIRLTLAEGTLQFTQPVNGVVFGATFRGIGRVQVQPPSEAEVQQLRLFTKQDTLDMPFSEATFSFTDDTFKEVASKVHWAAAGAASDNLYENRQQKREDLGAAFLPRIYKGIYSADRARTALFVGDLKTKDSGWVEVHWDALSPEEVRVGRWVDVGPVRNFDTWLSFPAGNRGASEAYRDPLAKEDFSIRSYRVDATVTNGAELSATARVTFETRLAGERVLLYFLDSNLRVEAVKDAQGNALPFFQARESKDRFQSYGDYVAVFLPEPTQAGQTRTLEFRYGGKRVIRREGNGNYFCQSYGWYPARLSVGSESFAARVDFELNFRSPKKYTLVATGNKVSETTDGEWSITSWKSSLPLAVAGFAFGDYKLYTEKVGDVEVQVYANRQPDDTVQRIQQFFDDPLPLQMDRSHTPLAAVGRLTPASMAKTMGIEMGNTLRVFEKYFGAYPYKQLAVTNIPFSYGQGWPGLIYLSALTFLDSTQRNALGIKEHVLLTDFFRAHESSHQWWGHRVGWKSYHDQWLSEGFAEFSGNLYVQMRQNQKDFMDRLRKDKEDLLARDEHNRTYESVGPVWMGHRLSSSESPRAYQRVIYSKGGYVLHMVRMMLFDGRSQNPEQRFQAMMQDFCKTFENKPASTEDFKAIVEKHMTPTMDIEQNHRMDWFFRQYVYGTGIPRYTFHYQAQDGGDGKWKVTGTLTREGVADGWKDIVPLYLHRGGGVGRLGFITAAQKETPFDFVLPMKPEKLSINYNLDLLAESKP